MVKVDIQNNNGLDIAYSTLPNRTYVYFKARTHVSYQNKKSNNSYTALGSRYFGILKELDFKPRWLDFLSSKKNQ